MQIPADAAQHRSDAKIQESINLCKRNIAIGACWWALYQMTIHRDPLLHSIDRIAALCSRHVCPGRTKILSVDSVPSIRTGSGRDGRVHGEKWGLTQHFEHRERFAVSAAVSHVVDVAIQAGQNIDRRHHHKPYPQKRIEYKHHR
jgi:hypothetical protein